MSDEMNLIQVNRSVVFETKTTQICKVCGCSELFHDFEETKLRIEFMICRKCSKTCIYGDEEL